MPDDDSLSQEALDALLAELGEIDTSAPAAQPDAIADDGLAAVGDVAQQAIAAEETPVATVQVETPAPPKASDPASPLNLVTFGDEEEGDTFDGFERVQDIPLEITVELGRTRLLIKDILELGVGSIIELEKMAGEPVDLFANGLLIARGEVVVIEDNFGVRITEIITAADRNASLKADR